VLRLPAVAGRFYPSQPGELTQLVREYAANLSVPGALRKEVRACLVPHAGYFYSGHVAGAVFASIILPKKIIILGVRHQPHGALMAILSTGAWRTPLGDSLIHSGLAAELRKECSLFLEDDVAHQAEHSLEVQLPFLQVLAPAFTFVPIAIGTMRFADLVEAGEALGRVLANHPEVLLLTTSDLNHYEDDATTRRKDQKAIERLLALDPRGLFNVCRDEQISMCGVGPAVVMLTALNSLACTQAELVRYATSADVSGDLGTVVGYAGMLFS
jgi:AmmeMemoRadiSam system protein B